MEGSVCEEREFHGLVHRVPSQGKIHEGDSEHHELASSQGGSLVSQQEMAGEFYPLSGDECQKRMIDRSMMGIPSGTLATEWEEFQAWKANKKLQQRDNKRLAERGVEIWGEVAGHIYPCNHEAAVKFIRSYTGAFDVMALLDNHPDGSSMSMSEMDRVMHRANKHEFAQWALEFFEKSQGAKFELVEALYAECAKLAHPYLGHSSKGIQEWCHVSFIAKPMNADCTDVSPKHFFGELLKLEFGRGFDVKYCCTFEPSHDPGFKHGCVFCPADQKSHPGPDGYSAGHPPYFVSEPEDIWI